MKTLSFIIVVLASLIWGIIVAQTKLQINDIQSTQDAIVKELEKQNYCITPKIPCKNAE